MEYKFLLTLLIFGLNLINFTKAQHENIPYEDVAQICQRCSCTTEMDVNKRYHHTLNCAERNFKHILARWPESFGLNHNGIDINAMYSGNSIEILQQLPATNASLTFSCRHCGIKHLQAPTFMDAPNIKRLDLSWNNLTGDELTANVFRGPFRSKRYEPISLQELDLSHNQLSFLDRKIFEHTPNLTKLDISHNKIVTFYAQLTLALSSVPGLEILDLSFTSINSLPTQILLTLKNLKVLNLAGNNFTAPTPDLWLIRNSLQKLNLADNHIEHLDAQSFIELGALKHLNISHNKLLKTISKKTFSNLTNLESLHCTHNSLLQVFDLTDLLNATNLAQLDLSHCSITSLTLNANFSSTNDETSSPKPWPKLRTLGLQGNPWQCDCDFFRILEYTGGKFLPEIQHSEIRCDTPYIFSGALISNLTAEKICSMKIPKKYQVIDEDPPRFLRKRYIILTLITAAVVIGLGLIIGLIVAYIRRRLESDKFSVEPIRYRSVRCSTLAAFTNPNENSRTSA